jgi:cell division protein ZapA
MENRVGRELRRSKVEVEIYKDRYTLSAISEPEYIRQLAHEVDDRMRDTAESNPHLGPMRVALLALLGLAADLNAIQNVIEKQEESLTRRCLEIEEDIERLLGVA